MRWYQRLGQESFIAFALGAVPVILAYCFGGSDLLNDLFKGLVPAPPILWYIALLPLIYVPAVIYDRYVWKYSDSLRARSAFWRSTWREIGTALHGLWRVMAGCFICLPFLWLAVEFETFKVVRASYFLGIGLVVLVECWFFSFGRSMLEERRAHTSSVLSL